MHDPNWNILENGAIKVAIIGVLAILALFLFAETVSVAENFGRPANPATDTISVNGTGSATAAPDIAHITFGVSQTASNVADAQAAATKQGNAAIAAVEADGVATSDIATLSYDISPQYSNQEILPPCPAGGACPNYIVNTTSTVTGYQVSETIQITARDLTKVSALLQTLGSENVQNVSGPDFALSDPSAPQDQARAQAIANAQADATKLAAELGVHLGKVVSFSDDSGPIATPGVYAMAANTSAAAPNIPAGENTYNENVSITYEIQ